jgi:hypothetical protein
LPRSSNGEKGKEGEGRAQQADTCRDDPLLAHLGSHPEAALDMARFFQFDVSLKWVPMKGVKKLAKPERKAALMAALEAALPTRKAMLV